MSFWHTAAPRVPVYTVSHVSHDFQLTIPGGRFEAVHMASLLTIAFVTELFRLVVAHDNKLPQIC